MHRMACGRFSVFLQCAAALALLALLTACAEPPRQTGPAPKGTQKPYTIGGRTYYPLKTADGYSEEGIGSWYGRDFHGRSTSSGERYDMHRISAAHKLLPMFTELKVTNLENGRTLQVRVNDRGPFVKDRIIDLSYAAAKELGYADKGTARVRIQAVGAIPGAVDGDDLPGPFYVQVGAFGVADNAYRLAELLRRQGYAGTRVQEAWVGSTVLFRVQAGEVPRLSAVNQELAKLLPTYPDAFVVAR